MSKRFPWAASNPCTAMHSDLVALSPSFARCWLAAFCSCGRTRRRFAASQTRARPGKRCVGRHTVFARRGFARHELLEREFIAYDALCAPNTSAEFDRIGRPENAAQTSSSMTLFRMFEASDVFALLVFLCAWLAYALVLEKTDFSKQSLNRRMNDFRSVWIRRVLHRELSVDPGALGDLVKAALAKLSTQEIYRVRVHPEQEKLMRAKGSGPVGQQAGAD